VSVLGVLVVWSAPGEDFAPDALDILKIFAAIAGAAIVNLKLYTTLQKSFLRTLQSLAASLEARDEYTRGHSERVMKVALMIAEELGVPSESMEVLRSAAELHDIGKIGVPDAILRKAGKLTAEEWETMRRHPIVSEEICRPLGLPDEVLFLIKHHHERIDGKGYPAGLPPEQQPLLQRILVVADSFDAMRSRRPYRDVMSEEELLSELNRSAGRTMDPTVVEALKRLMDRGDLVPIYAEHDRLTGISVRPSKANSKAA
jgi:putative nucleotidyltransferase with HDIG domain